MKTTEVWMSFAIIVHAARFKLDALPTELLLIIFEYCTVQSLGRLSCTCKRFYNIISDDEIWLIHSRDALLTGKRNLITCGRWSHKELCRISSNWVNGRYNKSQHFSTGLRRYLPWLLLDEEILWISKGEQIDGLRYDSPRVSDKQLTVHLNFKDICKFVKRGDILLSGHVDGMIAVTQSKNKDVKCVRLGHSGDVNAVDMDKHTRLILSGGKDNIFKVWALNVDMHQYYSLEPLHSFDVSNRILSISLAADSEYCCVGTSAINSFPLRVYDLSRSTQVHALGADTQRGAGILDIQWYSPHLFLSASYDTYVRLWDNRCALNVAFWADPFDCTVYCIQTDKNNAILAGTSMHGRTVLYDMRKNNFVQMYMARNSTHSSSPVYSLRFNESKLFVALDTSLNVFSFAGQPDIVQSYLFQYPVFKNNK